MSEFLTVGTGIWIGHTGQNAKKSSVCCERVVPFWHGEDKARVHRGRLRLRRTSGRRHSIRRPDRKYENVMNAVRYTFLENINSTSCFD